MGTSVSTILVLVGVNVFVAVGVLDGTLVLVNVGVTGENVERSTQFDETRVMEKTMKKRKFRFIVV